MKKISVLVLLIFFTNHFNSFAQQYYYTFSELKGMEDSSGDTHLFYRLYTYQNGGPILADYSENSIYHLDLNSNQDSLFIFSGGYIGDSYTAIADLDFWNNNPSEYIMLYLQCSLDCDVYIRRFDEEVPSFSEYGFGTGIEISKQNDSLVLATANFNLKSTDGGRNWEVFDSTYRNIISINPYNDDIFLGDNGNLYKSTDGGLSFSKVDTISYYYSSEFYYDKDSIHIYNLLNNRLKVSNDSGSAFSWTEGYSSSNPIYVSVDYSQSGSIYLADGRYIYHSIDYGLTFTEYKALDRRIVGVYKKPDSDKLYAATKYDLYEIAKDTITTLKHNKPNPDIFSWYPLSVGNKWVYEQTVEIYNSRYANEVVGDTMIAGKYYFKIKNYDYNSSSYYYVRVDSSNGKVYRYIAGTDNCIFDFTATEAGDTVLFNEGEDYEVGWVLEYEEQFNQWGLNSTKRIFSAVIPSSGYNLYSFVKNIGLYRNEGGEVLYSSSVLKGFVSGGIVYGDISLVDVEDYNINVNSFNLSQNYPNPFNPRAKIGFRIANYEFVSLKVYDLLGSEVATLVDEEKPAGKYEIEWSAENLSSGIYFYVLNAGGNRLSKKMTLIK